MARQKRHLLLLLLIFTLLGILASVMLLRRQQRRPAPQATAPAEQSGPSAAPTAQPSAAPTALPSHSPVPIEIPARPPEEIPILPPEEGNASAQTREAERDAAVLALFESFAREHTGNWGLCFVALPGGEPVLWDGAGGPMVSASLIKLPIMAAVYEAIAAGKLDPAQCEAWLGPMITVSDNASANALVRLLGDGDAAAGMAAVNDWSRRQGLTDTRQNRLMLEDNGLQNYTSAADCARLLAAIYRGDCVSPEASREMLELLLRQEVNDRLPLGLPEGTPIAHKTGDLIGLCWADVGIVFSPGGDYILCVISDGQAGEWEAKSAAAELSRRIYGLMNP